MPGKLLRTPTCQPKAVPCCTSLPRTAAVFSKAFTSATNSRVARVPSLARGTVAGWSFELCITTILNMEKNGTCLKPSNCMVVSSGQLVLNKNKEPICCQICSTSEKSTSCACRQPWFCGSSYVLLWFKTWGSMVQIKPGFSKIACFFYVMLSSWYKVSTLMP